MKNFVESGFSSDESFVKRLNDIVAQFENEWKVNGRPDIAAYASRETDPESKLALLRELVCVDMEFRLYANESARVESYLKRFAELAADDQVALELIAHEKHVLASLNQTMSLDDYASRFPTFREQLPKLLTVQGSHKRRLRLNCPYCINPIVVFAEPGGDSPACSSCGSRIEVESAGSESWTPEHLPKLDKFQLLEKIGRGAFGSVYRAKDTALDRTVAIKIPRSGRFFEKEEEDRFAREARSVAQLNHPGIVAVFDVGRTADFPYIVSEFVDGVPLDEALRSRRFTFRETALIIANLADALQHAHDRGVVHRDLKPANIMLQPQAERAKSSADSQPVASQQTVLSIGRPRLMDFGLARRDGGDVSVTMEGQVVGTPAYMSPEQARGELEKIDRRSDVYSLGVVLYEMVSGELPFRGTMRMLLHQVIHDQAPPTRQFNSHVPAELDTICLKCLEKDPEKRYQTAIEITDELKRFLRGEPILARPVSRIHRAWRWCHRNPVIAMLAACLILALMVGVGGIAHQWLRAEANANEATKLAEREADARKEVEREAATLAEVNNFFNRVLGSANPAKLGRNVTVREAVDNAAKKIDKAIGDPEIEAAVRKTIGVTYRSLSDLRKAVFHLRRSVELYQQVLGGRSLKTLSAMDELASALRSRDVDDDLRESEAIRRTILEERTQMQGADHSDTLTAMGQLANVLAEDGRHHEAIELYEKSLKGTVERFGIDSNEAAVNRYNLAFALFEIDEFEKAETEFRKLRKIYRKNPKTPDALNVANLLAGVLHARGKTGEAKSLYESTLKWRDEVLGPKHSHTLSTFRRLTRLLVELEEFDAALPLLEDLLARQNEKFGRAAGLTFGVRKSLAFTLEGLGRIDDAEKLRAETYDVLKSKRGARHKYTNEARQQLIEFYELYNMSDKAAALTENS